MKKKPERIFIIGFMGSGKTTLGKVLAKRMEYSWLDLDQYIEETSGHTVTEFFDKHGEAAFREMESEALRTLANENRLVVSCGGGTPCFGDNMAWMKANGQVVYLQLSPHKLLGRLRQNKDNRPLVAKMGDAELKSFVFDLLERRSHFYDQADFIVEPKGLTKSQVSKQIEWELSSE